MTTLSRDEIIAICTIDRMQKSPRHAQLIAARMPLMYTPTVESVKSQSERQRKKERDVCDLRCADQQSNNCVTHPTAEIESLRIPPDCSSIAYTPSMARNSHAHHPSRLAGTHSSPRSECQRQPLQSKNRWSPSRLQRPHTVLVSTGPCRQHNRHNRQPRWRLTGLPMNLLLLTVCVLSVKIAIGTWQLVAKA